MTAKSGAEKDQKQMGHTESLKGALAEVLGKSRQEAVSSKQAIQKPPQEEKRPFEVSEDALQKVLKGET
jgi:hypothetical protein